MIGKKNMKRKNMVYGKLMTDTKNAFFKVLDIVLSKCDNIGNTYIVIVSTIVITIIVVTFNTLGSKVGSLYQQSTSIANTTKKARRISHIMVACLKLLLNDVQ